VKILELESSKGWGGQEKRTVRLNSHLEYQIFWGVEEDSELFKRKDKIKGEFFDIKLNKIYNIFTIFKLAFFVRKNFIDLIVTHSGKDAWIGNFVSMLTGVPVIRVRHLIMPIKSPKSYNLSTKVVCVSKQVKEYLKSKGVKEEKLEVIYTGIDTDKFIPEIKKDFKKEWGIKDEVVVGIVAVLRSQKRHMDLLEAIKTIDNIKLIIVGEGPQRRNIENFIKNNNLENKVIMMGHREDVDLILPNFDIFVLPSREEALGTSLLEAQSAGVCALGSRVGGIPECIKENHTGLLFEPLNPQDLKEKLQILVNDKDLREQFSNNAREFIVKNFSVEKMVKNTKKLYERVVDEE